MNCSNCRGNDCSDDRTVYSLCTLTMVQTLNTGTSNLQATTTPAKRTIIHHSSLTDANHTISSNTSAPQFRCSRNLVAVACRCRGLHVENSHTAVFTTMMATNNDGHSNVGHKNDGHNSVAVTDYPVAVTVMVCGRRCCGHHCMFFYVKTVRKV